MALMLRVQPGGAEYLLPADEDAGEMTRALAEVLGNRACVVIGYEVPGRPRDTAVVLLNGNVVEAIELVEVPDEDVERPA